MHRSFLASEKPVESPRCLSLLGFQVHGAEKKHAFKHSPVPTSSNNFPLLREWVLIKRLGVLHKLTKLVVCLIPLRNSCGVCAVHRIGNLRILDCRARAASTTEEWS